MQRERKRRFGVNAIISRLMMALTPKRLFLSLCISISLLRSYTFFSRSPLVSKTLSLSLYLQLQVQSQFSASCVSVCVPRTDTIKNILAWLWNFTFFKTRTYCCASATIITGWSAYPLHISSKVCLSSRFFFLFLFLFFWFFQQITCTSKKKINLQKNSKMQSVNCNAVA